MEGRRGGRAGRGGGGGRGGRGGRGGGGGRDGRGGRGGRGGGGGGGDEGDGMRKTLQDIKEPVIRRLARRAGVKRISKSVYMWTRDVIEKFLQRLIKDAFVYTRIRKLKTCTAKDVILGLKRQNRNILGRV